MNVSARTPTFHLQLRLVAPQLDSSGNNVPFYEGQVYQITWGGQTIQKTLPADGVIKALLDGDPSIPPGKLQIGVLDASNKFAPRIEIPLVRSPNQPELMATEDGSVSASGYRFTGVYKAHDIEWRLANLMLLGELHPDPTHDADGNLRVHPDTEDAVRRFKALHHAALELDGWLGSDPLTGAHASLNPEQDDAFMKLLLQIHDNP